MARGRTVQRRRWFSGTEIHAVLQIGHKLGWRRDIDARWLAWSRRGVPVAIDMAPALRAPLVLIVAGAGPKVPVPGV